MENEIERGFGSSNDEQRCWLAYLNDGCITYTLCCRNCGLYELEPVGKQAHYHECQWTGEAFHAEIELKDFPARIKPAKKKKK